jgi:hypothetical protein
MMRNITITMTMRAVHIPASKMSPTNSQLVSVTANKAIKVKKYNLKFFIVVWLKAKVEHIIIYRFYTIVSCERLAFVPTVFSSGGRKGPASIFALRLWNMF